MQLSKDGKVIRVYRKKFIVHIERLTKDKVNGTLTASGIQTS